MRTINSLFRIKTGFELEGAFYEEFSKSISCQPSTEEEDKYKGTDFFVEGIPVDLTYNMVHKDHIATRYEYNNRWTMAIRTGNSHNGGTVFDTPVLVLGLNVDDYENVKIDVLNNIAYYIGNKEAMASAIADTYWAYIDSVDS